MRKVILSVVGLLLIVVSLFVAKAIIDSNKKTKIKPAKVVKTVFVDTVQNKTIPITITANGNLVAKKRLELFSEVQGIFRGGAKLFKTGQKYQTGQTLIRIDAAEYYASVQSAKSNLYNLITSIMPDLRLDYPEVFDKWQNYLTSFDLTKATPPLPETTSEKEKYFITGRNIYSTYYNVKNLEQRLSKYIIAAPFKGVLTEALVTEGTLIRPGQKLGEYIETGTYEMEVAVPKEYGDLLKEGKSVQLTDLNKTKTYTGTVSRINSSIDQATQTITTFIEIQNPDLKEGMYLEANLDAKQEPNAIEIDRGLLQKDDQIFVVRDSILAMIDVRPVFFSDKKVVLKGVPDGGVILNKPVPGAYAGMLVKVYEEKSRSKSTEQATNISTN
ncbi:efflux RND transporter periplasmic adaptor subunit [Aquimarina brevivitae]|uniref:Multidrug efflux pump subunit AcrA (Membrane-fusion protein) n=1 Tax=Aquimarina brevivitae TaxID=323412 RepID=A0A4Q7PH22_9FLAO|nr:HlyD family efflux transporter periplasmic adaptor subunit [Aquimarina brevivitae]RZS99824.1 multidrug efflux pump subunit AcrA (membrane-fusion protein) [Aquimarina brevivitae]